MLYQRAWGCEIGSCYENAFRGLNAIQASGKPSNVRLSNGVIHLVALSLDVNAIKAKRILVNYAVKPVVAALSNRTPSIFSRSPYPSELIRLVREAVIAVGGDKDRASEIFIETVEQSKGLGWLVRIVFDGIVQSVTFRARDLIDCSPRPSHLNIGRKIRSNSASTATLRARGRARALPLPVLS